jgi:succinate dehydrogenase/fumarate reductase flavoprotein subunit
MSKLQADVIVVAAGASGLAAAIAAVECGASVLAFEKARKPGHLVDSVGATKGGSCRP